MSTPSKRPPGKRDARYEDGGPPETPIPPPPETKPEGVGVVITEDDMTDSGTAEDYYKRIHAHRTVLAMKAVRLPEAMAVVVDDETEEQRHEGAQALLKRVFEAEKESTMLRERLEEVTHERDAARGEVLRLRAALAQLGSIVDAARS